MKKILFFHTVLLFFFPFILEAEDLNHQFLMKKHPASTSLQRKYIEFNLEYALVNDSMDLLNLKEAELGSEIENTDIGNYDHLRAQFTVALSGRDMLSADFVKRHINAGTTILQAYHYELSYRHSFSKFLSLDAGLVANDADNIYITKQKDLNTYIHKLEPRLTIDKITPIAIWFIKDNDDSLKFGLPFEQTPYFSIEDMYDVGLYLRSTVGYEFKYFYPNLYLQYGYTKVSTKADTNLFNHINDESIAKKLPDLPLDLSHEESYLNLGINTFVFLPYHITLYAQYSYIQMFREASLNVAQSNHLLNLELQYLFLDHYALSLGGNYLNNHFNGTLPILYNEQSKNSFDHKYGWATASFSYFW